MLFIFIRFYFIFFIDYSSGGKRSSSLEPNWSRVRRDGLLFEGQEEGSSGNSRTLIICILSCYFPMSKERKD